MKKEIEKIVKDFTKKIATAKDLENLRNLEIFFLGRKGLLPLLLRKIPTLDKDQRAESGKIGNQARQNLQKQIEDKRNQLQKKENKKDFFDITLPGKKFLTGRKHPISQMITEIENVFARLGFQLISGPEIEDDWHNFEALNFPPHHPAREMQDTFFIKNLPGYVLRTQTSNMQIRHMENNKPPFKIVSPGKTFRKDSDATHSPMFHQFECLLIDKDVSLANLKWVMQTALRQLLRKKIDLRFRLSFFPFTEPSLEVDATCVKCWGKKSTCRMCKGTGWLEVGGAGMVHPNVLKNCKIDPQKWNGFAFGCGIERIIMLRYEVDDLRLFFNNDLRFLEQFH